MTESIVAEPVRDSLRQHFTHLRNIEFPWTAETTYLNNASIGPIPERTRRTVDTFTAKRTAPYLLPDRDLEEVLWRSREAAAQLIHAQVAEVGLATNTGQGINLAASALPLRKGDTVLLSDREFPSNVYPWLMLRDHGIDVEFTPVTEDGFPDEERLLERLQDPRVRVLAISYVQFHNGYRADLDRLGAECRASGTFFVVDGIQGIGQIEIDVMKTPMDILACGGQKWLMSPWGSGFVYVRRDLLQVLEPKVTGWMAFEGTDDFSNLTDYNPNFHPDARRYEHVTLPFQDFAGFTESVHLLLELEISRIAAYLRMLVEPIDRVARNGGFRLASPTDNAKRSAVICVVPEKIAETFHRLRRANIVCSMREGAIRLSPHCYNTVDEMERVAAILVGE